MRQRQLFVIGLMAVFLTACSTGSGVVPLPDTGGAAPSTAASAGVTGIVLDPVAIDMQKIQDSLGMALSKLAKFTENDLTIASKDAAAHGDIEASACWDGLLPIIQALHTAAGTPGAMTGLLPKIAGAASLFQAIRDFQQGGGAARSGTPLILKQINLACGPLYVSAKNDTIKLLIAVGALASGAPGAGGFLSNAGSGLGSLLPGLPGLPLPIR